MGSGGGRREPGERRGKTGEVGGVNETKGNDTY